MEDYYKRYEGMVFPTTRILLRSKEGTQCFRGPPSIIFPEHPDAIAITAETSLLSGQQLKTSPVISSNGIYVAYLYTGQDIAIHSTESGDILSRIPCPDAESVEFSPMGTFLTTWSRPTKSSNNESRENFKVWHVLSATMIAVYHQRTYRKGLLQWLDNELTCLRLVTNEVHQLCVTVTESDSSSPQMSLRRVAKLHHQNVTQFSVSPKADPAYVALFTPEHSGKTARVSLYSFNSHLVSSGSEEILVDSFVDTRVSRSLFSASDCKMFWRPVVGDTLLVQTSSDVDTSGNSYYGQTGLFIVNIDGSVSRPVPQSKDGAVYGVQWSPNGSCFIVAAGKMPCHVTLFSPAGEATYEFGALYRDVVSFSPHGRFLCLAGFGNLGGDMNFYEITETKKRQIGTASSHGAIAWGWSPDSRYFMTSTLTPRMNVDNGFKIFRYNGEGPILEHRQDSVYDVLWIPRPPSDYPDRARSPSRPDAKVKAETVTTTEAKKPASTPYRPPGSTGALAEMLRKDKEGPKGKVAASSPAVAAPAPAPKAPRRIPGMPPPPEPTSKPQQNQNQPNKPKKTPATSSSSSPAPPQASSVVDEAAAIADLEKKKKALNKKIKQIEELKVRQANGEGLNAEQIAKIGTENSLREELASLK